MLFYRSNAEKGNRRVGCYFTAVTRKRVTAEEHGVIRRGTQRTCIGRA